MKLIDTTCPHCGSVLKIDTSNKNATCEYCGTALLIDDEVQHFQYDNAEEAGYMFEKGRQRAQTEVRRNSTTNSQQYPQPPKKRTNWFWVLGWICIFPLPLTILMLRKKEMKPAMRNGIIAAAWIVYLLIAFAGGSGGLSKKAEQPSTSAVVESFQTDSETTKESEASTTTETKPVESAVSYADDEVVNRFITEFNNSYGDNIHDISKGNIRTKYYGYIRNTRLEMINANSAASEAFSVSIYGGKEDSDRDAMFTAFKEIARVLEPSLTNDAITAAVDRLISDDELIENYKVGNTLTVSYVPTRVLSYEKTDCRVDILASNYK